MRKKIIFGLLILMLVSLPVLAACTGEETTPASSGGTLKIILSQSPGNACGWPADLNGPDFFVRSSMLCLEPLLRGDNDGNIYPWLAESYEIADDFSSITFKLEEGVRFHDGTDFNAEAAKWNLDILIAAGQQYWDSVDVVDDYTIRVNLNGWSNTILTTFRDDYNSWMVSPTACEQNGEEWMRNNPVGTGPFKFVSFDRDVSFITTKNTDYWREGEPLLDAVEIIYVTDLMTQQATIQSGEADVLEVEPGKIVTDLEAAGLESTGQISTVYTLIPDTFNADSPFVKKEVREAVEYAIDREAIAEAFGYGQWEAPYQLPAPSSSAYDPDFKLGREYNPDKARQLLEQAGYPDGFNTTILCSTLPIDRNIVTAMQSDLAEVGIIAEVEYADFGRLDELERTVHSYLALGPLGSRGNFNETLVTLLPTNPAGPFYWDMPAEFLEMVNASLASPEPDVELMRACTDFLTEGAEMIPVFQAGKGWVMQSYVKDGGWFERSFLPWWKPEQTWLDK